MAKAKSKPVNKSLGKLSLDVVAKTDKFEKDLDRIAAKLDLIVKRTKEIVDLTERWNAVRAPNNGISAKDANWITVSANRAVSKANRRCP